MAKWDFKDDFWQMDCREGEEWNFSDVLPPPEGTLIMLVVPTLLQIGWVKSPPYSCAATETAWDIATEYTDMLFGSIPDHKFAGYRVGGDSYSDLPKEHDGYTFLSIIKVCVCVCVCVSSPPVLGGVLLDMQYQSLVYPPMTPPPYPTAR
jgi:hypothetical protein